MQTQSLGIHQQTYDAVFQHPVARNLQWRDVRSMLASLSEVAEEQNGNVKFSRNGQTLTMHPPKHKDVSDPDELMKIRHFLERSGTLMQAGAGDAGDVLVVIDHREARVFKTEMHGAVPDRITLVDAEGANRHLHNVDDHDNGQRRPEVKAFYEAVASRLAGAGRVLIFGNSTGASSAMDHLVSELKAHHPAVSRRVIDSLVVDQPHMTDDQLLAKARETYAAAAPIGATA